MHYKLNAGKDARRTTKANAAAALAGREIAKHVKASSNLKSFPNDTEIEQFDAQLNMQTIKKLATSVKTEKTSLNVLLSLKEFKVFLNQTFAPRPTEDLILAMFERFKPFKLVGERERIIASGEHQLDFLDFIIAMNLLSRVVQPIKRKLLFDLCDIDDDGCMMPQDILDML